MIRPILLLVGLLPLVAVASGAEDASTWTVYITNDNCPDYTWGFTEEQTRQAFADIVRAHLDEMKRTDDQPDPNRNRYNMAVTQEAICFIERYPERKQELIDRIRQGRVFVSPYLCNTLWGFQSEEGVFRAFYPARRLEKEWGTPIEVAEHIELPSLPWGTATLLSGCGIRWLSVAILDYDCTFAQLKTPPLFELEGPDGSRIRVVMDRWAAGKANYTQGASLLSKPDSIVKEWIPHYARLGMVYPLRFFLASGTHGDINPGSGGQARGFSEAIINHNSGSGERPRLVNATVRQFCDAVDAAEKASSFLPKVRGCFGHSWDLWPVSLARYAAQMRDGERAFLAAEALLATLAEPALVDSTRAQRERAEWNWAMLSDHAWNGTNEANRKHNAELRQRWAVELSRTAHQLQQQAWASTGLQQDAGRLTLFNPLSVPRGGLVRLARHARQRIFDGVRELTAQHVREDETSVLYFVSPPIAGYGVRSLQLADAGDDEQRLPWTHGPGALGGPFYSVRIDPATGGVASLVHKPTGTELVTGQEGRSLCQTVYVEDREFPMEQVRIQTVDVGPVLARLRVHGSTAGISLVTDITLYAEIDQVDFDVRIDKPVSTRQQRLCQMFPVMRPGAVLRADTTGAVIRPRAQVEGDLLAGADTRRLAVQGFIDASTESGMGVTIAPIDAFALRLDLGVPAFESLGNDQNFREVAPDQHGCTQFRFRYTLRAHSGGYAGAEAFNWSRSVATPLLAVGGTMPGDRTLPTLEVDPARALATCLKPVDGDSTGGTLLRIRETAGKAGPLNIGLRGYRQAIRTDLLERDQETLAIKDGHLTLDLRPHGFCAVRLLR